MKIAVVGLGKLGAPLAAVLASKGNDVRGIDVDRNSVRLLNEGKAPVAEPGLDDLIGQHRTRLSATENYSQAISEAEVTFVVVPTPSCEEGMFSLRYVMEAVEQIGKVLSQKRNFHLVVITSTIMPGDTDNQILPALEQHSGKRCGEDFGLCYNPEFIALGSVISDMLHPDFVLIGEADKRSGDILESIYRHVCNNDPQIRRMNFINAEITKLAVNTFVTTKISYANMLAGICARLPGANVDVVTSALGQDSRIGSKYLKAATGYGGPCFPRDNAALGYVGRKVGSRAILAEATEELNREHTQRLAEFVLTRVPPGGRVGILGLAYKPDTNVVEESAGVAIAQRLAERGIAVIAYDPAAMDNARSRLDDSVLFASSVGECVRQADAVVVTIPLKEFRNLAKYARPGLTVIDCWRFLERDVAGGNVDYVPFGIGQPRSVQQTSTAEPSRLI